MRVKPFAFFVLAVGTFLVPGPVSAHHGNAAYDSKTLTTLNGTVTDFQFMNPHSEIYFDVTDAAGKTQKWIAESLGVASLSRSGWTRNMLKPGDQIKVTGNLARNGSYTMRLARIVLPNGKELSVERGEDAAGQ